MKGYLTILGTLALVAAGCSGEFSSGNGNGIQPPTVDAGVVLPDASGEVSLSTAEALFNANVRPLIMANCSPDGACHSSQAPAFVTTDLDGAYELIGLHKDRLYPNYESVGAAILDYGTGNHKPQALFTPDDMSQVQGWLAIEKMEADVNAPQYSALQIWSGCMNLDDWEEENVADLWADKNANGQGNCDTCHNLGADGFMASNQSARVFDYITRLPALMPSYFTISSNGTKVDINRSRLENVGTLQEPHQAHGAFNVDGNAMEALVRFHRKTQDRVDAAAEGGAPCDPPRY